MELNRLRAMVQEQKDFQKNFFDLDTMTDEEKVRHTKENILALHRELGEVLNEIPWKIHRANKKDYDLKLIHEELIDCLKFLLNVCIIWGMGEEELYDGFMNKSAIVRQRFENEKDNIHV